MNTKFEHITKILDKDNTGLNNLNYMKLPKFKSNVNIELTVFDKSNKIINTTNINFLKELNKSIFVFSNKIILNPGVHLRKLGYSNGKFKFKYSFFLDISGKHTIDKNFIIKEISASRTELKFINFNKHISINSLFKNYINNNNLKKLNTFINFNNNKNYLLLNVIDDSNTTKDVYKLKILSPLDLNITEYNSFWISKKIIIDYEDVIVLFSNITDINGKLNLLKSPNIQNSNIGNLQGSTDYSTFSTLTEATNSLDRNKIINFYLSSSLTNGYSELNIDYRDYNNFIHFSSVEDRLNKFKYKINKIEFYDKKISQLNSLSSSVAINTYEISSSIQAYKNNKFDLINNFDGYENFMYYESRSYESSSLGIFPDFTWPKYNTTKPYLLYSTTSSNANTWYANQIYSASTYDNHNNNKLINNIPILMLQNDNNNKYITFIKMIAHKLDIFYNYINSIGDIFTVENSIYKGTPKSLINELLYNFGINIVGGYNDNNLEEFIINSGSNIDFSIAGSHI